MKTITFYSYKGGVGRSLTLANVATFLAKFGQKVCLLDLDLEAPGLNYKFQKYIKHEIKGGVVDYVYEFINTQSMVNDISNYYTKLEIENQYEGSITLIPAGDIYSKTYWKRLASINWNSLFYDEYGEGVPLFLDFKERIRKEINPDFLLIDSRTGITEISGVSTSLLSDYVVFLSNNSSESIDGLRHMVQALDRSRTTFNDNYLGIYIVLTRIPFPKKASDQYELQIVSNFKKKLFEGLELSNINVYEEVFVIHSDPELEINEALKLSENKYVENPIVDDYINFVSKIVPDYAIVNELDKIISTILSNAISSPDQTQEELESLAKHYPHYKTYESLAELYILRRESKSNILEALNKMWQFNNQIDHEKLVRKYIEYFLKENDSFNGKIKYNLNVIEKNLTSFQGVKYQLIERIAKAHLAYKNESLAKIYFNDIITKVSSSKKLEQILDYLLAHNVEFGAQLVLDHRDLISQTKSTLYRGIKLLYLSTLKSEIVTFIDNNILEYIKHHDDELYIIIQLFLKNLEAVEDAVQSKLNKILAQKEKYFIIVDIRNFFKFIEKNNLKEVLISQIDKHPKQDELHKILEPMQLDLF
ncbi:AAA family ATPase [uncultured Pontibacter sp.]|uniref:ParA family protein n=1 Tax=uncultured Pontibacter sp. TaxID=453356 RepID=UPI0026120F42|nr:AAA family ATPase [uncultured Pontibacter sp.]